MSKYKFKFIDLFAGIGGFHQAMTYCGGECVFASEIDQNCIKTYQNQFKMEVHGDIDKCYDKIPKFDVLCGGFPCQTFSKAGNLDGFNDKEKGKLFFTIIKILKLHPECKFIILENVRNLADDNRFWSVIQEKLKELDFYITQEPIIESPDNFGIPQNRERVYILGIKKELRDQSKLSNGWIHARDLHLKQYYKKCIDGTAFKILDENNDDNDNYIISNEEMKVLNAWEEFKKNIIPNIKIGAPIWLDFFGIGVDKEFTEDWYQKNGYYRQYKKARKKDYADDTKIIDEKGWFWEDTPEWKQAFIRRNRELYLSKQSQIDKWYKQYQVVLTQKVYRKFEWNCGPKYQDFKKCIIQFRQSGLRIKRSDKFPSLVAIVNTPIIYDNKLKTYRRITVREAANLQSFRKNYKFICEDNISYKQLGNAVNVKVIKIITKQLFSLGIEDWDKQ